MEMEAGEAFESDDGCDVDSGEECEGGEDESEADVGQVRGEREERAGQAVRVEVAGHNGPCREHLWRRTGRTDTADSEEVYVVHVDVSSVVLVGC